MARKVTKKVETDSSFCMTGRVDKGKFWIVVNYRDEYPYAVAQVREMGGENILIIKDMLENVLGSYRDWKSVAVVNEQN